MRRSKTFISNCRLKRVLASPEDNVPAYTKGYGVAGRVRDHRHCYQKITFKMSAMRRTKRPRAAGRLCHGIPSSCIRGVSDETKPFSSSSDFWRFVSSEITIVMVKHAVQAKMAVQKFCAISLG